MPTINASSHIFNNFSVAQHQKSSPPHGQQQELASRGETSEASLQKKTRPFNQPTKPNGTPLDQFEIQQVIRLKKADQDIRAHEKAHMTAAGVYLKSGAVFEYERGPDGKMYAVHGEVSIDTSQEISPKSTIAKMRVVSRSARAPVNPSPQDMKVAAKSARAIVDASHDLQMQKLAEAQKQAKNIDKKITREKQAIEAEQQKSHVKDFSTHASKQDSQVSSKNVTPKPPARFIVSSIEKYSVNTAQYQYSGGLSLRV